MHMKNVNFNVNSELYTLILLRYSWVNILLCAGWSETAIIPLNEVSRTSVSNKTCNHQQNKNRWLYIPVSQLHCKLCKLLQFRKNNVKLNVNS